MCDKGPGVDILIAGVSVRGLVESAVRSGSGDRIVAVDYFGDFDLQLLCEGRSIKRDLGLTYDVRHLMTASDALAFDALAYVANLENYPSVVEALGRGKPVLGNSLSALKSVRDPGRLFGFLERSGFPAPQSSLRMARSAVCWASPNSLSASRHLGPADFATAAASSVRCRRDRSGGATSSIASNRSFGPFREHSTSSASTAWTLC